MPIISTFFGIIIRMYFGDHNPPHFHVEFQGEKATFTFDGALLAGTIFRDSPETGARLGSSSPIRTHDKLEKHREGTPTQSN
jgi:Domain of unknown function (DUF4160)